MEYSKPWLSLQEQVELLRSKGLSRDPDLLKMRLEQVGYYRLSAYWFPYKISHKDGSTTFENNTSFDAIWDSYEFDRELRVAMFEAVGEIEVFLRSQLAHHASQAAGPFEYPQKEVARLKRECAIAKRSEAFMRHFFEQYGDSHELPPWWMSVEATTMGTLEALYADTDTTVRSAIAHRFNVKVPVLKNWLSLVRVIRNACCHHSRVWNRIWGVRPKIPNDWNDFTAPSDRTFAALSVLNYMLICIDRESDWKSRIESLLQSYPVIHPEKLGFPEEWRDLKAWTVPDAA